LNPYQLAASSARVRLLAHRVISLRCVGRWGCGLWLHRFSNQAVLYAGADWAAQASIGRALIGSVAVRCCWIGARISCFSSFTMRG